MFYAAHQNLFNPQAMFIILEIGLPACTSIINFDHCGHRNIGAIGEGQCMAIVLGVCLRWVSKGCLSRSNI